MGDAFSSSSSWSRRRKQTARLWAALALLVVLSYYLFTSPSSSDRTRYHSSDRHPHSGGSSTNYNTTSTILVVAALKSDDTAWIQQHLPALQTAIYTLDDPTAAHSVPTQKGNEAMAYLTYIIDNYHHLPELMIFTRAAQTPPPSVSFSASVSKANLNDDLFSNNLATILQRLRLDHVRDKGYFNLRCNWAPRGCPQHLNLETSHVNAVDDAETRHMRDAWRELLPDRPLPAFLSQAAGSQFAATKDRVRATSRRNWIRYREWLVDTRLADEDASQVWEWLWQFVVGGVAESCPPMEECYCEGYGVCFGSKSKFRDWWEGFVEVKELEERVKDTQREGRVDQQLKAKAEERSGDVQSELEAVMREWR